MNFTGGGLDPTSRAGSRPATVTCLGPSMADAGTCLAPSVESSRPILSAWRNVGEVSAQAAGPKPTLTSWRPHEEVTNTPAVRSWDASESHRQPAGKI